MNTSEINETLHRLGFSENTIVETILITSKPDVSFNPAPMGIKKNGDLLECRPFNSSNTYRNLCQSTGASLVISNDPLLFFKTAFKDEQPEPSLTEQVLDGADAIILLDKTGSIAVSDNKTLFTLKPVHISIKKETPAVPSRGRAMALEAIIHATRVKAFTSEGQDDKVEPLLTAISYCFNVISRVSPVDSDEMKIVEALKELMKEWRVTV